MKVYFDNAATTKVRDEVVDEISDVLKNCFGNPSSTHSYGRSAKSYIETSRKSIAKILNCEPGEIIFNSGGTESDNSILKCAVKDLGVKHVISSKIEHHAILHALDYLEKKNVSIVYLPVDKKGDFIKKWVPEISSVKNIHDPSTDERNDLGYSNHLVDLKESRKKAIEAFSNFSK